MSEESYVLEASGLSIGYFRGKNGHSLVAEDLNLKLRHGELVCLLGPNGAGKSTLIRTLAGLDKPLAGRIFMEGADASTIVSRERARFASVVLTDQVPSGMFSAYSIVALGRHPHTRWTGTLSEYDRSRIEWALRVVDAESLSERQVGELSDGERQKVMIARALAQDAKVLFLDEPTAFVDLPRRVEIMRILRDLAHEEGLAVILSSHDLDLSIRCADELWLMNPEGIVVQGYPEDLALRRQIAQTFQSDEVNWDSDEGCFRLHRKHKRLASMEGEGSVALWTRRALARKGYGLGRVEDAELKVTITHLNGHPIWRARISDISRSFDSLQSMFRWVESIS